MSGKRSTSPAASQQSQASHIPSELFVYLEKLHERWVPRDQLEEWHRTLRPDEYSRRVRGVAVRFLAADMSYKVGWVCQWEAAAAVDGQDNLIVDAGMGATEIVLLRNVSNSKFTLKEVSPEVLSRLHQLASNQPKKATGVVTTSAQNLQPSSIPPPELHPHVLLIGNDGTTIGSEPVSEIVSRATMEDPDTPRAGQSHNFHRELAPPDAHMISREGTGTAAMVHALEKRSQASQDDERWLRSLLEMTRALAENEGRRGGGVSKPYYCQQVLQMCKHCENLISKERLLLRVRSPLYVFGDIHGNFDDLNYFLEKLIPFGEIKCAAASFLFLGDYVDRGDYGLECAVSLLTYKSLAPHKVHLLRGNHETPEVNGDIAEYGELSFKHECIRKFGEKHGDQVWEAINRVFRLLPGAAVIDGSIFCAHGGIPRFSGGTDDRLQVLDSPDFPRLPRIQCMPGVPEGAFASRCRQMMEDLVWSDPAGVNDQLDPFGFGDNRRGPGLKTFGSKAVDEFLNNHGFSHIFRAHQEKSNGLRISDNGRVVTIFSTSDYVGHQNGAGVVFVGDGIIRMIIKQPPPPLDMNPASSPALGNPNPRRKR
ncbi:Serine/threonine-protein phosphatase BSL3 [Diplonema papillatum]|nr:Serine/threonine-protein phosphatase BSL3 [Diplonema papillatum]